MRKKEKTKRESESAFDGLNFSHFIFHVFMACVHIQGARLTRKGWLFSFGIIIS